MNVLNYVKSLLPRLHKRDLTEELRVTIEELDSSVLPLFKSIDDVFKVKAPKSGDYKSLEKQFRQNFKGSFSRQPNIVGDIAKILPTIIDNARYLRESVEDVIENDIITEGITAKKAVLIRAVEHVSFISRYSLDLANYILNAEQIGAREDLADTIDLNPIDKKRVPASISRYAALLTLYGVEPAKFKKTVDLVPEVLVGGKAADSVAGMFKENEIDPLSSAYTNGFFYNPFLHFQLAFAQWQAARFEQKKAKAQTIELRVMQLRLQNENKSTPALEESIRYNQSRLDKLTAELREEAEEYGAEV